MSYTRDDASPVGVLVFDPVRTTAGTASGGLASGAPNGSIWFDAGSLSFQGLVPAGQSTLGTVSKINITPVTATNPSSTTPLMAFTLPAGALNAVNKGFSLYAAGNYTTASGQTPTITFQLTTSLGTTSIISSAATTGSSTTIPWNLQWYGIVATNGASSTLELQGTLSIVLGTTATAAAATYVVNDTSIISGPDLTASSALTLSVTMGSSNAGNSVIQRMEVLTIY